MRQQESWKDVFWSAVVMAAGWTLASSPPSLGSVAALGLDEEDLIVFGGGLAIGAAQWVVTTRRFGANAWWILAYGLGWSAGLWCGFEFGFVGLPHPFWMGGVGGAFVGVMQWLTLRNHLRRAAWWIAASVASAVVACWLGVVLGNAAYTRDISEPNAYLIGAAACGVVIGSLTSLALRRFTSAAQA
jgi:FtsH-binding integral membrane protein